MRIFYAADSSPNPDFASQLWQANLRDSLISLGHEVIEFQYDLAATFRHLRSRATRVRRLHRQESTAPR